VPPQRLARVAGLLYLVVAVGGAFGIAFVGWLLVKGARVPAGRPPVAAPA
jgi:hypothetical protein